MIADQMRKLYAFNEWAWARVFASVENLNEADYHAQRHLFEGTIHANLVHCLTAETIWLARINGVNPTAMLDPRDYVDFAAVRTAWDPVTKAWNDYMRSLTDEACVQIIEYRNTRGNGFSLVLVDLLQHVVNHATEHRSQLTPILYQLGVATQPLDYMRYVLRS